jgi:hypothetical protein
MKTNLLTLANRIVSGISDEDDIIDMEDEIADAVGMVVGPDGDAPAYLRSTEAAATLMPAGHRHHVWRDEKGGFRVQVWREGTSYCGFGIDIPEALAATEAAATAAAHLRAIVAGGQPFRLDAGSGEAAQRALDVVMRGVAESGLDRRSRERALHRVGTRLKDMGGDDALETLVTSMVADVLDLARPLEGATRAAFLEEVGIDVDIAGIDLEGRNSEQDRLVDKAVGALSLGREADVAGIEDDFADALVSGIGEHVEEPGETPEMRARQASATLRAMEAAPRSSKIGCDETMYAFMERCVKAGAPLRDLPQEIVHRLATAMHGDIQV